MDLITRVRAGRDDGSTTTEYPTRAVAVTGFVALLYQFLTSPTVHELLLDVLGSLLHWGG